MKSSTLLSLILVCLLVVVSQAHILNVPGDYAQIQAAIDVTVDGDTVLIQPGTYNEAEILVSKAIRVTGTAPEDSVVVASTVVDADRRESVFVVSNNATIDGLTIVNGDAPENGGGVRIDSGDVRVSNCVIRNCTSTRGGGVYAASTAVLERCSLLNNSASSGGGAYSSSPDTLTLRSCRVAGNRAPDGGGACVNGVMALEDCVVDGNDASSEGVGIKNFGELTVDRTTFRANKGGYNGGAIYTIGPVCEVRNSIFVDNYSIDGGGLFARGPATVLNCLFVGNSAWTGGAMWFADNGDGKVSNCTVTGNWAGGSYGGGVHASGTGAVKVHNSVLWANDPDQVSTRYDGTVAVKYSDVDGGWPGKGNISRNPRFTTYRGFNYVLKPGSPCIDTGDPAFNDGISDWYPQWPEGYLDARRSDMGAYGGPGNKLWVDGD